MSEYDEQVQRSLTLSDAQRVFEALSRLNSVLRTEFDGVLKQYNDRGEFVGLFWMDMESEEWMFDPMGTENDG